MGQNYKEFMREIEGDARTAMLYAYRYLLGREPENMQWVTNNTRPWPDLRKDSSAVRNSS